MRNLRLFLAVLFIWALTSSREAWAQTTPSVTGILGAVQRCQPPALSPCSESPGRAGVVTNAIDLADCEANLFYQFEVGIAYPNSSYQLEAWVGAQDCSVLANRQTSATSVCWPVAPGQAALTSPYLLDVRIQDIASGAFTTTHPVTFTAADPSACVPQQPAAGATNLTLYMFLVDGSANAVGTVQAYPLTLDMREAATSTPSSSDAGASATGATPSSAAGASCAAGGAGVPAGTSGFGLLIVAALAATVRKRST